ncbi:MAG: glycosyltransferase family 2 protein [Ilumatobacter sp.]|uniref:glycosyltransferase family 2 protein n=1 Tax=Ilumatobacter sp. TaxID=1967498 RepID=UPI0026205004|nr:glycosyltransferase family 2 protein [Ilumatobacter sp.]MDJ0771279.1 glycosyltransferase family 2 protein [Ilumatobacter sp.]
MIAAVVVTHSAPAGMLERCLGALERAGGIDLTVVVDNGDGEPVDADVVVIRTANRGYGAAANEGIAHARSLGATTVALLNDDVVVRPGWIEPLLDELAAPYVGAAQPALVELGTDPPLVNSLGVVLGPDGAGNDVGRGLAYDAAPPCDLELFTGGAVAVTPAFVDATGGFDERYFLYYEDVDLALRGAALGWRYRLVPAARVDHAGSATTTSDAGRTRYLQERNRLWVSVRFGDPGTIRRALWLSLRRLRHRPRRLHARALAGGLAAAPRLVLERRRSGRASA